MSSAELMHRLMRQLHMRRYAGSRKNLKERIQLETPALLIDLVRSRHVSIFICYLLSAICYSPAAGHADSGATGEKIFQSRCFVCHGRDGRGSGPASQGLAQKPQDLTDPSWQRGVTDDQIKNVIRAGGAIIGKSGAMPPNPDLSDDDLNSLLGYVRHLAGTR
jgi:mono/diheme cytochrome c family protein